MRQEKLNHLKSPANKYSESGMNTVRAILDTHVYLASIVLVVKILEIIPSDNTH